MNRQRLLIFLLFFTFVFSANSNNKKEFFDKLVHEAMESTKYPVEYDPVYKRIPYPNGDVEPNKGVCTDVIIRAYRKLGIDLQVLVHEDMKKNFSKYPKKWGLKKTDTNIDHRRVLNLMTFFERKGAALPITKNPSDYQPGDLVTWNVRRNVPHIGIVVNVKSSDGKRYQIVHNIGSGHQIEDCLFSWDITGHYRYMK